MSELARGLKTYLDTSGFHGVYKYLTTYRGYYGSPHSVHERHSEQLERYGEQVSGRPDGFALLHCLMRCGKLDRAALRGVERDLADALVEGDVLEIDDGTLRSRRFQLISFLDNYLFIDARVNFPRFGVLERYIGTDTYLMLYYLGTEGIRPHHRALDLCTGTGVGALTLSRHSDHVVATDIDPEALSLAEFNIHLNGKEGSVELRKENLEDTLRRGDEYDVVICNPPYVPAPDGLGLSLFAEGPDPDGQGYLRSLFDHIGDVLTDAGRASFISMLIGDLDRVFFFSELEEYCTSGGLTVDAFVDSKIPADRQIEFLSIALQARNPTIGPGEATAALSEHVLDRLKAKAFYCATMTVKRNGAAPGLRVFNRFQPKDPSLVPVTEWLRLEREGGEVAGA